MALAVRYDKEPIVVLKSYDLNQQNFQHLFETLISSNHETEIPTKVTVTSRNISQLAIESDGLIHARMLPSQQVRWYKTALRRSITLLDSQSERLDETTETVCQILCLLVEAIAKEGNVETATTEVKRQKPFIRACAEKYRIRILITICFVDSSLGDLTEANLECHREMSEPLNLQVERVESFFQLGSYYYLGGYTQQAYECYIKANKIQDYQTASSKNPIEWSENVESILNTYLEKGNIGVGQWHDWIRSTFELMSDKFEASPQDARNLFVLGSNLHKASMHGLALKVFFRAVQIQMEVLGENHTDTLSSFRAIGTVYFDDGNYTLALQYFNRSLLITNRIHGPNSRHATTLLIRIGKVLQLLGHADAVNYWKQALEIMIRLKMNDILMVSVLYRLAEWHSDRLRLFAAFDYHTRAYYLLRELKEEEQPVFPAARTVPSISTALQSIGSSVSIRNIVPPFITQCREDLFRLKEDLSALAWGTTEEEFLIRMVYMDYYLYYSLAIALLLCLYMKCILLP